LVVVDESNTQVVENDKPTEQTQSWVSAVLAILEIVKSKT